LKSIFTIVENLGKTINFNRCFLFLATVYGRMTIFIREKERKKTHDLYLLSKKQNIKQNWTYQQIALSGVTLQRLQ
jgi:hypothetical protein